MSLRSFRLIEELQRMFNETKSSQMPENAKDKSEEKKSPKMENSKVIAEFRILSNNVLEYLDSCKFAFPSAPTVLYIFIFTLFQLKQCSNNGIDQCKQEPKTSVDIRKEEGNSNVEIGYRISANNENFIHVFFRYNYS